MGVTKLATNYRRSSVVQERGRIYTKLARIQQLVEQLGPRQVELAARVRRDFALGFRIKTFFK